MENFNGLLWIMPIGRCILQAVQYLHVNQYAHQDIHLNNVFAAFVRNEMKDDDPGAILFKLGGPRRDESLFVRSIDQHVAGD